MSLCLWSKICDYHDMRNFQGKKVYVSTSTAHGNGVFASNNFKEGEIILTIDDSHVVTDATQLTKEQHEFDCDYLADKIIVMQEPEKCINHSCDPNTYMRTENGVRFVLTIRQINKDEEITYDYSINGDNDGTFICRCGSKKCRGTYQGNFFKLERELQMRYLPYLDDWFVEKYRKQIEKLKK